MATSPPRPPMQGVYTIVTGGSKGIGKETVRGLLQQGCHVVIAARDMEACSQAKKAFEAEHLPGTCDCQRLDLEDPRSIKCFAEQQKTELKKRGAKLRVLVNNAGVMGVGYTPAGMDRHMLCNHLGPFMLTRLLEDTLAPGSRVVNVASRAHYAGAIKFDAAGDWVQTNKLWIWRYSDSKLANVIFTSELQKRLADKQVASVSVSPGMVNTTLFQSLPWPLAQLATPIISMAARTPAKGAETVIYAATSPEVTGSTEQLFLHDCKPLAVKGIAQDADVGKQLWDWSQKWMDKWL